MIILMVVHVTIIEKSKDEFIFDQLEDSAEAKKLHSKNRSSDDDREDSIWVAHFYIERNTNSESYNVTVDRLTEEMYVKSNDGEIIEDIVKQIDKNGSNENKGKIKDHGTTYFYYVDWKPNRDSAMVFLTSVRMDGNYKIEYIGLFLLLLLSFFTSRIAAKRITKPIQELEAFAEEVSKRNWNVKVPKTDPDEIGLLAEVLERMRDSLRIAEERDRQFLQSTSHDLKTPVMIIKGYAQAMLDGMTIESEKSAAEVIRTESERLERRIVQLLRLNTLGHALEYNENRELVSIDRVLNSLVSKFRIVRPELHWDISLVEAEIHCDPEALLIAFENIIENQLRYAKSSISVLMNATNDDGKIEVTISNDGDSFTVEDPMVLFDAFKKDKEGKFGLGLAIVKQVIEAHEGTISAYNMENGVEFKILF